MTKYRLPDWLGGHEVLDTGSIPDDGPGSYVEVIFETPGRGSPATMRMALPRAALVVKPPSIDDSVELPLRFDAVRAIDGTPQSIRIESGARGEYAGYVYLAGWAAAWLTAEQCQDAARALWLLGTREASS